MISWLIGVSLRYKLVVLALAAGVMVFGVQQARQMPVDATPEFAPPVIEVQTEALGLSAPEVEELVTLNLEELLNGTPWLKSIRSTSVPGLSSILLTFEPGTDVLRARQLVSERLTLAVAIPNVAQPPVILQPQSSANRVMMVGLSSSTVSAIEMGVLARWNIRPALLSVPGVANVAIWGQRERQLQVQVDPEKLEANNISLDQIVQTTGNAMWVLPAHVPPGIHTRFRRLDRDSQPAPRSAPRVPHINGCRPLQGHHRRGGTASAGRRRRCRSEPSATDRRCRPDQGLGPHAGDREVPEREHPPGHP